LLTVQPPREVVSIVPAPSVIIKAAPNPAAEDIPRVKGDARGFLVEICVTTPAKDKAAPATTATRARGNRLFQTINVAGLPFETSKGDNSASQTSDKLMPDEPTHKEYNKTEKRRIEAAKRKITRRLVNLLYWLFIALFSFAVSSSHSYGVRLSERYMPRFSIV